MKYESEYLGIIIDLTEVNQVIAEEEREPVWEIGYNNPTEFITSYSYFAIELNNGSSIEWSPVTDKQREVVASEIEEIIVLVNLIKTGYLEEIEEDIEDLKNIINKESFKELLDKAWSHD